MNKITMLGLILISSVAMATDNGKTLEKSESEIIQIPDEFNVNIKEKNKLYLQLGVSKSNSDETLVKCRASAVGVVGYDFHEYLSVEGRYTYGLGDHYTSYGLYLKPKYENFNLLFGYGSTEYKEDKIKFEGGRVGAGYTFYDRLTIDAIYRCEEEDTTVSLLWKFKF